MVSPPPIRRNSDAARSNRLKRILRDREESLNPAVISSLVARRASSICAQAINRVRKAIDKLALRRSILPKSRLGKAIHYAFNQWTNLEVYLGDGRLEICNNLVENAIRPTKLGEKLVVHRQ